MNFNEARPNYNPNGDKSMNQVWGLMQNLN